MKNDLAGLMDRVTCNDDGICADPFNRRFTCQLDEVYSPMVCGLDLEKKTTATTDKAKTQKPMTMEVSEVSSLSLLELRF